MSNFSSRFSGSVRFILKKHVKFKYAPRFKSTNLENDKIQICTEFQTFQDRMNSKRSQAAKSIVVQVQSAQSYKDLYDYCSSFGNVKEMFHYTSGIEPMHFILVEFNKESEVSNILSSGTFVENQMNNCITPVVSQFLWFKAGTAKNAHPPKKAKIAKLIENGTRPPSSDEIREKLKYCENVSDQMRTLFHLSKLSDLETRLRFLTARQVEMSVSGMLPNAAVLPFGSSMNGFGKMGCDLDLVLKFDRREHQDNSSRFVFHCKSGGDKTASRNLEILGDFLQFFLPGCTRVRKILQARVPIVKYYQQFTDVECDLSMSNVSGVHMSDFLYVMGMIDHRVRPLVFTIRKWAQAVGLTNSSPGRWITNFSITLLVLAFLQKPLHSPPVLPTLNFLVKSAGSKDVQMTEEGVNCTFLRDVRKLQFKTENEQSLEELLCEFFEFYSQFDFKSKSVCLNESINLLKPEHNPLYIVNPLERTLNVSKNVSIEELEKFKTEVRNAAWTLQSEENKKCENWGLLSILERGQDKKGTGPISFYNIKNPRLMEVRQLFDDDQNGLEDASKDMINEKFENNRNQVRHLKRFKHLKKT